MAPQPQSNGERTLRRVAASYRKAGYRVVVPSTREALPPFLHDHAPDLIAERDDDRVVVEIKPAGSLKGANDLVELAERIAAQPGWRLELITFKDKDPDAVALSPDWLQRMLHPPNDDTFACVYRTEVLGFLLRSIALGQNMRGRNKLSVAIAHELAFAGLIDATLVGRIDDAFHWQAKLMQGQAPMPTATEQAVELENLCLELFAQTQVSEGKAH